ncbi:lysostaphin resistance A-like protein [Halomonas sp. AOP43-F2-13]|uniref:lysostaphin resistance A-like protein n=1 Tax=Halomonas sp. AOP43-F2-13 TaxID=3457657 RepID=UPI004033591E
MDDHVSKKVKGRGLPFARRWHIAPIILAIAAWIVFRNAQGYGLGTFDIETYLTYRTTIIFGAALIPLAALFLLDKFYLRQGVVFIGDIDRTLLFSCLAVVLCLYLAAHSIGLMLGYPREQYMQDVYQNQTTLAQLLVYLASLIVFVPVVEELLFRHFILSVIPFRKNFGWAVLSVIVSCAVFSSLHQQYELWTTYVTLFGFAVVACVARILSQGMLLPMLLHAFAIVIALSLNEAVQWLENVA